MNEKKYTPKVLHTSVDGKSYICGDKVEGSWHDRCLNDRFARTLPLCEGCEEVKGQRTTVTFVPPTTKENMLSSPSIIDFDAGELYVKDYRRDA